MYYAALGWNVAYIFVSLYIYIYIYIYIYTHTHTHKCVLYMHITGQAIGQYHDSGPQRRGVHGGQTPLERGP